MTGLPNGDLLRVKDLKVDFVLDGVTIPVSPLLSTYEHGISIRLGYPGADFWRNRDDPRDAPDIRAALEAAGKLKL